MAPNPNLNSRSFVSSSSSSSSSFPTINKYAKYFDVDDAATMNTTIATKTTALEFSSSENKNTNKNNMLTSSSCFFYNHDYDDELDQFWKNKRDVIPFYDHDFDRDLDRYCKEQRTLFLKRLSFERLYLLKTELGYSQQEINAAYIVVATLRNQQQLKKATQTRGRGRGHRRLELKFNDSDRSFFLTNYNQQARMIINRAVHASPVRC